MKPTMLATMMAPMIDDVEDDILIMLMRMIRTFCYGAHVPPPDEFGSGCPRGEYTTRII